MAESHTIQTGKRIETHIKGRVFASPQPQFSRVLEKRRVCVLSNHSGRMLQEWGQWHPCFGPGCHDHQTREAVEVLVRDGVLRWVGKERNVAAFSYGKTWKPKESGGPSGPRVWQLTVG
jgi:hypothetical protein